MNDRFKFRAEYVYRGKTGLIYFYIDDLLNINHDSLEGDDYLITIHDPTTIEQCTGLKDKNGRLIYEGDIVRISPYCSGDYMTKEEVSAVEWEDACWLPIDMCESCVDVEVIGNIHENPELLSELQ